MRTLDRIIWWAFLLYAIYAGFFRVQPKGFEVWIAILIAAGGRLRLMDLEEKT